MSLCAHWSALLLISLFTQVLALNSPAHRAEVRALHASSLMRREATKKKTQESPGAKSAIRIHALGAVSINESTADPVSRSYASSVRGACIINGQKQVGTLQELADMVATLSQERRLNDVTDVEAHAIAGGKCTPMEVAAASCECQPFPDSTPVQCTKGEACLHVQLEGDTKLKAECVVGHGSGERTMPTEAPATTQAPTTKAPTTAERLAALGFVGGDRFLKIGRWYMGDIDGAHFSFAHENGNTAVIYRSDGTIHEGNGHRTDWNVVARPVGKIVGVVFGFKYVTMGQWRLGDVDGWHFSISHKDGFTAQIWRGDGTRHCGANSNRKDWGTWLADRTAFNAVPSGADKVTTGTGWLQIGDWRFGEAMWNAPGGDGVHASVGHKDGKVAEIFRDDSTCHYGPRDDYWPGWA